MDQSKLKEFNEELKALLLKYDVSLTLEDVPASKKIVVVANKKPDEKGSKSNKEAEPGN